MATTSEIIGWALRSQAKGYSKPVIVSLLNEAQNILYKQPCAQTMLIDDSTGLPPTLTIKPNIRKYDGPEGTWRIGNIILKARSIRNYEALNLQDYNYIDQPRNNTTDWININGNHYYNHSFLKCDDAVGNNPPQITFTREPSEIDKTYYVQAFKTPTQILSDQIQLTIPDSEGSHRLILFPTLMALIEAENHGNYVEMYALIEREYKPAMARILNKGAQGKRHRAQPRPY